MANSTVLSIDPNFLLLDTYSVSDENLISNQEVTSTFNPENDYVEYYIYGLNNSLLYPSLEDGTIPYSLYSILDNELFIDPSLDLETYGFEQGSYNVLYNFYSNRLSSSLSSQYFISEISSDRTEIRLDSNEIEDEDIISSVNAFIAERQADEYYPDFLLNFGSNRTVIANNILLDGNTVLIKLYEPLPPQFNVKSTLWVVEEVSESTAYNITFEEEILEEEDTSIQLKGPNINLSFKDEINNSTEAVSLSNLDSSPLTSSYQQLQSLFNEEGIQINVDYTEYSNFVNFSSIEARLENFEYKLQQIEDYKQSALSGSNVPGTTAVSGSKSYYESLIDDTIKNFDGYEHFLYFSSGSKSWPKSNIEPPFINLSTTDQNAIDWYNEQITSASLYDELNQDNLFYNIPEYLRNDPQNQQYIDFIEMIGQHFDNIWIYLKDISNKYNADNRIDAGVSKDLVAQTLRDFSLKIYQNNFSSNDIYSSFLGLTPSGSLFPFPEMTGSLPTPSGFEYVDTFISSSDDAIPLDDINKRIYKRLYHNLPYLFKSKGTIAGIKTLLNTYGVPDTILRISEFGGKDKVNTNDYDYWYNKFNYAFETKGEGYISSSWNSSTEFGSVYPSTLEFRFKTHGIPTEAIDYKQVLWTLDPSQSVDGFYGDPEYSGSFYGSGSFITGSTPAITIRYEGTGNDSGSFDGSIPDPYNEYTYIDFYPDISRPTITASVYVPTFDAGWWSLMVTRSVSGSDEDYTLYVKNSIYNGDTGTELGFQESSSVSITDSNWEMDVKSYFGNKNIILDIAGDDYYRFSGSYQEIRYYKTQLNESVFNDYVMNPLSIESNKTPSGSLDTSPDTLMFRASLGSELDTGSISIHPKVTGSWILSSSFSTGNDYFVASGSYDVNREYYFFDEPAVGLKNRVNDKIRAKSLDLPSYSAIRGVNLPNENTLSSQISIQQDKIKDDIYTNNVNLLEVTFSPQNELNDDIVSQLGHFNIGDLIGDPRDKSTSSQSYPELDRLRQDYFLKYVHQNYDFNDYVRLIKFFDNSLFKMIKDFVPARTSLASGITIKPHILERQKYPEPQSSWQDQQYTGSIKSFARDYNTGSLEVTSGGNGGSFELINAITASLISGGTGYQNPPSNYSITTTGGGGTGLVISIDSIDESFVLRSGESLVSSITQTSDDYTPGTYGYTPITSPSGIGVQLSISVNGLGEPNVITVVATTPSGIEVGDTLTIPKAALGGTQDLVITLQTSDLTNNGGPITGITLVDGGSGYTSIPTLTINGSPGTGAEIDLSLISKQKWNGSYNTPTGVVNFVQSDSREFINGELSGSTIITTNGNLSNPKVTETLLFTTSSSGNESQAIGFSFQTDRSYQLVIEATNQALTANNFHITDLKAIYDPIFYESPKLNSGDTFKIALTVDNFYLNNQQLLTPELSFVSDPLSAVYSITASIYENFIKKDNLVTSDNAVEIRPGTLYQDVDYSHNALTPVNFNAIISGSASIAPIPDSNYSTKRITIPRYEGSRLEVSNFNTGSGDNVQVGASTYMAYYTSISSSTESGGQRIYVFPSFLIDSVGDIIEVTDSEDVISLLTQNFTSYNGEKESYSYSLSGSVVNTIPTPEISKSLDGGITIESLQAFPPQFTDDPNSGIIYPKGLNLTSANETFQKVEQILKEAKLI